MVKVVAGRSVKFIVTDVPVTAEPPVESLTVTVPLVETLLEILTAMPSTVIAPGVKVADV